MRMPSMFRLAPLFIALLMAGCASLDDGRSAQLTDEALASILPPGQAQPTRSASQALPAPAGDNAAPRTDAGETQINRADTPAPSMIYPGNDQLVRGNLSATPDPALVKGERVSLNFENATVESLASALLGDVLGLNYTVDAGGGTQVSLRTSKPIERSKVLDVLDTVLLPHDLAIVRDSADVYHVTQRSATSGTRPLTSAAQLKSLAGAGTVIVPLNHIGAAEMAKILGPLAPADALVHVDTLRNLLVLQGSKVQLEGWIDMVEAFDVDYLAGMSLGVFPLEYANVNDVYDTLQTLLSPDGATLGATAQQPAAARNINPRATAQRAQPRQPQRQPTTAQQGSADGPLGGLLRIFPLERLNALVVVTPRKHVLDEVQTWIKRLDQPTDSLEAGLFVYPVQNGSAIQLAELLNGLFGGGTTTTTSAGVAGGQAPTGFGLSSGNSLQNRNNRNSNQSGTGMPGISGFGGTQGVGNVTTVTELEGDVRVVADERRNALLIRAPRTEFRRIKSALRELDTAPTQVLIEASIVEVNLVGNLQYGVQWYFQNRIGGGRQGAGGFGGLLGGDAGADSGAVLGDGFSYSITNSAGIIRATLNALAKRSVLRVLSNPSVLVLDNHKATIQIGKEQPVRTGGSTIVNGAVISDSFSYKDTGVLLTVTPSVNKGGLITMDIAQQVTDVGEIDAATLQRDFLTRQIESRVAVRSGETIVLGGMIRENETSGKRGVPGLSELPLLGNLFSTTEKVHERTELIVLLTPRALENDEQLRAASVELRERIRGLQGDNFRLSTDVLPSPTPATPDLSPKTDGGGLD